MRSLSLPIISSGQNSRTVLTSCFCKRRSTHISSSSTVGNWQRKGRTGRSFLLSFKSMVLMSPTRKDSNSIERPGKWLPRPERRWCSTCRTPALRSASDGSWEKRNDSHQNQRDGHVVQNGELIEALSRLALARRLVPCHLVLAERRH